MVVFYGYMFWQIYQSKKDYMGSNIRISFKQGRSVRNKRIGFQKVLIYFAKSSCTPQIAVSNCSTNNWSLVWRLHIITGWISMDILWILGDFTHVGPSFLEGAPDMVARYTVFLMILLTKDGNGRPNVFELGNTSIHHLYSSIHSWRMFQRSLFRFLANNNCIFLSEHVWTRLDD